MQSASHRQTPQTVAQVQSISLTSFYTITVQEQILALNYYSNYESDNINPYVSRSCSVAVNQYYFFEST